MRFILTRALLLIVFAILLVLLIAFGRGYRIDFSQQTLESTGILVASSSPDGAKILIDGELHGATNSNITLNPGVYDVEIQKDGFSSWKKQLTVKGELVVKADALLFPKNPSLSPVTSLGIVKAVASDSTDKIIILSEREDLEKDGIYLLENSRNPLSTINPLKLLALKSAFPHTFNLADTEITFSPDEKQLLITLPQSEENPSAAVYLIATDEETETPFDVTQSENILRSAWEEQYKENMLKILETFKKPITEFSLDSFNIVAFSPNEEKILYTANQNIELPIIIQPRLIATNQTEEIRNLKAGNLYVYDMKEDKNFEIYKANDLPKNISDIKNTIMWYPDSNHLVIKEGSFDPEKSKLISVIDYDGTIRRTVYSGPFEDDFLSITKDGKLFILINLNTQTDSLPDVYTVGIR